LGQEYLLRTSGCGTTPSEPARADTTTFGIGRFGALGHCRGKTVGKKTNRWSADAQTASCLDYTRFRDTGQEYPATGSGVAWRLPEPAWPRRDRPLSATRRLVAAPAGLRLLTTRDTCLN